LTDKILKRLEYEGISFRPGDYSDEGNSKVFVDTFGSVVKYCATTGWLYWDGKRWIEDEAAVEMLAKGLTDSMLAEAENAVYDAHAELAEARMQKKGEKKTEEIKLAEKRVEDELEFRKKTLGSRSRRRIMDMLRLAQPVLTIKPEHLDANPFYLNTPGGIVDLRTGQVDHHDPIHYCTKMTRYTPNLQESSLWNEFLDAVCCGNLPLQIFLQQVAGMAAVGKVFSENLIIAIGSGANGKSTLFNVLAYALGDYAGTIAASALTTNVRSVGAELANLKGKRLVIAAELEDSARLSTSMLKQLTSTDKIHAERKFRDPEDFTPSHTTILYTNHLPRVGSTDEGTWRRLLTVPFNATFPTEKQIKNFADTLARQAGGAIVQWILYGAYMFYKGGYKLDIPDAVAEAVKTYRADNDWINHFIEDCCEVGSGFYVGSGDLYDSYKAWAERTGEFRRHAAAFNAELDRLGYELHKPKNRKTWYGLRLTPRVFLGGYSA